MYYQPSDNPTSRSGVGTQGLPMTPSVALRSLFERLQAFQNLTAHGTRIDVHAHFRGPITPPVRNMGGRPMGDPVFDSVAEYASQVIARAGLLTTGPRSNHHGGLDEFGRITRHLFAIEHALAVDLGRTAPRMPLRQREFAARGVLALAAYWCDRREIVGLGSPAAHPLLGVRPSDPQGIVLFDHAHAALQPPRPAKTGGALGNDGPDFGIGINRAG